MANHSTNGARHSDTSPQPTSGLQTPEPSHAPAPGVVVEGEVVMERKYLEDWETTEAIRRQVEQYCASLRLRRPKDRRRVEEDIKLQFYFGGKEDVAYLPTKRGLLIITHGRIGTPEFGRDLSRLTEEERKNVVLYTPAPLEEPVSTVTHAQS